MLNNEKEESIKWASS